MAASNAAGPVTTDQAVMTAAVLRSNAFATQMQPTLAASQACAPERAPRCRTHEAAPLLAALPGASTVDAARLTAAMGPVSDRWTTADARRCCSGVAPVLARRGTSTWSRWRDGGPTFLRPSVPASAGEASHHAFWARAYAMSQRARGTRHQAAVSALACPWIRIIYPCGPTRPPYRDVRDFESLRKKGAPLLTCAAQNPS
jgi:hypothetical protein